jgi:uncharacterized protein with HEPN domain
LPSERPIQRLNDIISNIDAIGVYTAGMTAEAFVADAKTRDATQHCLLRISEAAVKLGELADQLAPGEPWGDIRPGGACDYLEDRNR